MNRSNCTNLKQFEGGRVVKQGDSASLFGFAMYDERWTPIDLDGREATIHFTSKQGKASFNATVQGSKVSFKIPKVLPVDSYLVEVECAGYVFPSDQSVRVDVVQSAEEYQPDEMVELGKVSLRDEIANYLAGHTVQAYNDGPLVARIEALEARPQATTVDLSPYLTSQMAYQTFATYATLQSQMTTNIKENHLELGLDALIDEKLKNGGDPFVTQSKLPTIDTSQLASKNDLEELKRSVGSASDSGVGTVSGDNYPYDGDNINMLRNIPVGSVYVDRLRKNGALKWIKTRMYAENATRDQAKSCWNVLFGDTGNVKMPMTGSPLTGAVLTFRRINNIVELTWGGLSWGWFGIKRRGADGYVDHPSNREKFVTIIKSGNIKSGFIPTGSKLGYMMNDSGITQGTFYVSGRTDGSHVRLQFLNDVPTDRDIGDLRFTNMSYTTDDPWPETI